MSLIEIKVIEEMSLWRHLESLKIDAANKKIVGVIPIENLQNLIVITNGLIELKGNTQITFTSVTFAKLQSIETSAATLSDLTSRIILGEETIQLETWQNSFANFLDAVNSLAIFRNANFSKSNSAKVIQELAAVSSAKMLDLDEKIANRTAALANLETKIANAEASIPEFEEQIKGQKLRLDDLINKAQLRFDDRVNENEKAFLKTVSEVVSESNRQAELAKANMEEAIFELDEMVLKGRNIFQKITEKTISHQYGIYSRNQSWAASFYSIITIALGVYLVITMSKTLSEVSNTSVALSAAKSLISLVVIAILGFTAYESRNFHLQARISKWIQLGIDNVDGAVANLTPEKAKEIHERVIDDAFKNDGRHEAGRLPSLSLLKREAK